MTHDILSSLDMADGLARVDQLLRHGHARGEIANAVRSGRLWRPRRGWVASAAATGPAVRAVTLGGRLGGNSALLSHGIWADDTVTLSVACPPTASRLPPVSGHELRLWVADVFPARAEKLWRVSVLDALLQLSRTASRDAFVASLDSALQLRRLTRAELRMLHAALPRRMRSAVRLADARAMSGAETHMRLALLRAGYRVRSQVRIQGIGIVDLLVDDWLIVEIDSHAYHAGADNQRRDRLRDGNAVLGDYGHERFLWEQVRDSMDWCLSVVERRLRDGRPTSYSAGGRTFNRTAAS